MQREAAAALWNSSVMPVQRIRATRPNPSVRNVDVTVDTKVYADVFFSNFDRVEAVMLGSINPCSTTSKQNFTVERLCVLPHSNKTADTKSH